MNTKAIASEMIVGSLQIAVMRKPVKNLHLNVLPPHGQVRVSVPPTMHEEAVRTFVASKLPWIRRQITKFQSQARETKRSYISGESHYFQGKRYLLRVVESENKKGKVEIKNKRYLDLHVPATASVSKKEKIMEDWYRAELKKQVTNILPKWEQKIGEQTNEWHIRRMKTKWGTCNVKAKRIWLNLELAKKPAHCVEYILVHELVHLLERSHNDRFVGLMSKYMPDWKTRQQELNNFVLSYDTWE